MNDLCDRVQIKEIFQDLHQDQDCRHTLKAALTSAENNVPLLTDIAVTVDS